ncbi:hypothetical protein OC846_005744 [Tilletia horrida]|uniref:Uncharacterized protein n=1 Tax=Tilletia horrida TaxID=155126 RepID=A0AAN6GME5_9BASI|nr:hypothetical protein OC845_006218 [Tilletia horrida]KAK0545262.1 hypothetical protein OC846_005744 [Tilletia horrida]KAK0561240.1 hypothetical protein OC861_005919 [Tilletia horrida]
MQQLQRDTGDGILTRGASHRLAHSTVPHQLRHKQRGPIHDAINILHSKKTIASNFCSTFLHLPPYAATKTITKTTTFTTQVPLSTTTVKTVLTSTATPVTVVDTTAVIVPVTPTVDVTVVTAVPSTSTVATITSVVTQTSVATVVVTQVSTVFGRNAKLPHDPSRTRLPYWLNQYSCPQVSKACSHIASPKTKTVTKMVAATVTVKSGAASVGLTSTAVVTPTQTSIKTVTSTSTAPGVTSTIVSASSSLVPVTATVVGTTVVSVTTTVNTVATTRLPVATQARILLKDAATNSFFGYIADADNNGFRTSTGNQGDALVVDFVNGFIALGGPDGLKVRNQYPYLGAVLLDAPRDLSTSTSNFIGAALTNYVYTGTQSTDTSGNQFAQKQGYQSHYESQIWKINSATLELTIDWTNENGDTFSKPTMFYDRGALS